MKFAVDRIEENIAILENITTQEKIEIAIEQLPKGLHEGAIIVVKGNKYILDSQEEDKRRKRIQEKLNRLKGLKKNKIWNLTHFMIC